MSPKRIWTSSLQSSKASCPGWADNKAADTSGPGRSAPPPGEMPWDTTTSFDGFLEGTKLMMHVASKQKPSRTGQLHSKRPSAAAAACLWKPFSILFGNTIIWHMLWYDMIWHIILFYVIQYIIWYYIVWYDILWYYIVWYDILWHSILFYSIILYLYFVMLYKKLYYIILYYFILYYIISYHIIFYYTIFYYIIFCYVI